MSDNSNAGLNLSQINVNVILLGIAIIGGTIAMDSRYVDTTEADRKYLSRSEHDKFMRSVQDLHTQQTASLLELRARELSRLHSATNDPTVKREIQNEINLTSDRMVALSKRYNRFYETTDAFIGG